jgi:hypothetical protein
MQNRNQPLAGRPALCNRHLHALTSTVIGFRQFHGAVLERFNIHWLGRFYPLGHLLNYCCG